MKISWAAVRHRDWSRALPYHFGELECGLPEWNTISGNGKQGELKQTQENREEKHELCVASVWYRKILIAFSLVFSHLRSRLRFAYLFACITTIYRNFCRFSLWLLSVVCILQQIFPTIPFLSQQSIKIIRKLFEWLRKRNSLNSFHRYNIHTVRICINVYTCVCRFLCAHLFCRHFHTFCTDTSTDKRFWFYRYLKALRYGQHSVLCFF